MNYLNKLRKGGEKSPNKQPELQITELLSAAVFKAVLQDMSFLDKLIKKYRRESIFGNHYHVQQRNLWASQLILGHNYEPGTNCINQHFFLFNFTNWIRSPGLSRRLLCISQLSLSQKTSTQRIQVSGDTICTQFQFQRKLNNYTNNL